MMTANESALPPRTAGVVLHRVARYYDLMTWLMTMGRENAFRERLIDLARVSAGESILDAGCGTGTLAIAAKRRAGSTGTVHAVDASPEMIMAAKLKAQKAGVQIAFANQVIEALPFPDGKFDAVMSTLMFHHLPRKTREQGVKEMRRVLKKGGRVFVVDFGQRAARPRGLLAHFHPRHGYVSLPELIGMLQDNGLSVIESGPVGTRDMNFVLASAS